MTEESKVQVRDVCIWSNHIENNDDLIKFIENMSDGEIITLEIDGARCVWEKMNNHNNGHGLKPHNEKTRKYWRRFYKNHESEHIKEWLSIKKI